MAVIEAGRSALLVVDVQQRLAPAIHGSARLLETIQRLMNAAAILDVPSLVTEHNPDGLGHTVESLRAQDEQTIHKMTFDACRTEEFIGALPDRRQVLVTGCEAHVCVLQTTFGLMERGYQVSVIRDAVGSRRPEDAAAALERFVQHGIQLVTSEMVMFEWLGSARHPRFKDVLALIKEQPAGGASAPRKVAG